MARHRTSPLWIIASLMLVTACSTAHAERVPASPGSGAALVPAPPQPAYLIDIIDESGSPLTAYQHRGRTYVLGTVGQRYTLRVFNPTPRRVEAVVSVDGLDVIDGEPADLRKRGYVVPPHGELRIEGFRVSTEQVAAFRFSSVRGSYAGRKGKARNVGVIGIAIFEEQEAPQIVFEAPPYPGADYRHDHDHQLGHMGGGASAKPEAKSAERSAAPRDAQPPPAPARSSTGTAPSARRPAEEAPASAESDDASCCRPRVEQRPGLGTEFGERRYSSVSWTRFVRASEHRPNAVVELRYNDLAGLQALGIPLAEPVSEDELLTRETANPFPGDHRFAQPPR